MLLDLNHTNGYPFASVLSCLIAKWNISHSSWPNASHMCSQSLSSVFKWNMPLIKLRCNPWHIDRVSLCYASFKTRAVPTLFLPQQIQDCVFIHFLAVLCLMKKYLKTRHCNIKHLYMTLTLKSISTHTKILAVLIAAKLSVPLANLLHASLVSSILSFPIPVHSNACICMPRAIKSSAICTRLQ